jgi:hypothetical protein
MTTSSAQYTYLHGSNLSRLIDQVNDFCQKYPEYRLFQVIVPSDDLVIAILTTDPY